MAYLTDAGKHGLIVMDVTSGKGCCVLDGKPSVTAPVAPDIVHVGKVVKAPNGAPLHVHSDPLELSPDGKSQCFGPLEGPWSRISTRVLDDMTLGDEAINKSVEPFADLPPVGCTTMDSDGTLHFSDLAEDAAKRRAPDSRITTAIKVRRLH